MSDERGDNMHRISTGTRAAALTALVGIALATAAFAVVATGETRLYGCILVRKGVIRP